MKNRKPIVYSSNSGFSFSDGENGIKFVSEIIKNLIVLLLIGVIATFIGLYANRVIPYIGKGTLTAKLLMDLLTMPLPPRDVVSSSLLASVLFGIIFYSPYFLKINSAQSNSFTRFMGGIVFILFYDLYFWDLTSKELLNLDFINPQRQMTLISQSIIVICMAIFTSLFNKLTTKTSIIQIPEFGSEVLRKRIKKVLFFAVSAGLLGFVVKFSDNYFISQENIPIIESFSGLDFVKVDFSTAIAFCVTIITASIFYWPRKDEISRNGKVIRFLIDCGCGWLLLYLYPLYPQPQEFISIMIISGLSTLLLTFVLRSLI